MARGRAGYKSSGFGLYLLLYFFTGLIVIVVAYFLAVLTLMFMGFTVNFLSFPPSVYEHSGILLILLWILYVIFGHFIAYKVLWEGRVFG